MNRHLFDSTSLSLEEFCLKSHSINKMPGARGKVRDVVDAFRTVYWFHGLRIRTLPKTLYQLEKRLEPEAFGESRNGVRYRRNKWRNYQAGRHTPPGAFVAKIEERCEGSRLEFGHVLWDVLRLEHSATRHAGEWIQRLEPKVQSLLWQKPKKFSAARIRHRALGVRKLTLLERHAGLDALACLTLLLREAHETGNDSYAFELSRWLCRMLVLTGGELQGHGIGRPLHEFYELRILPLGELRGLRYSLIGVAFWELIGWLSHALYHLDGVKLSTLTQEQTCRLEQRILSGEYGFDYFYLLNPVSLPVDLSLPVDHPLGQLWVAEQNLRFWALNARRNWTNERFPPNELLAAAAAAHRKAAQYQRHGQR